MENEEQPLVVDECGGSSVRPVAGRGFLFRGLVLLLTGASLLLLLVRAPATSWARAQAGSAELLGLNEQPSLRALTLARFLTNDELNGLYVERLGRDFVVNGHSTFWSELDYFIYWCPHSNQSRWLVSWNGTLEEVRDLRICHYVAASPLHADLLNGSAAKGWSEWDSDRKSMTDRPNAGVEVRALLQELEAGPGSFSSPRQWPACGETFASRVRTQSRKCNNCWAAAVAQVLEWRLCIAVPDHFKGPSAFISAGYLTSCAVTAHNGRGSSGCDGGSPLAAMRWASSHGVPTGGDGNNLWTCVPEFFDGVSSLRLRARGSLQAPSCPTSCTSKLYKRSLQEDLFMPEGWNESWVTTAFESAVAAIRWHGPIVIGFPVDRSFADAYRPGTVYRYDAEKHLFDHLAVAVGYGPDYIEAVNSWGLGWGARGTFLIHKDSVRSYAIPGHLQGHGDGYPFPLPRHGANYVVVAGFRRKGMNGRYTEMQRLTINGYRPYLEASSSYFLYWCHLAHRFAIAGVRSLPEIRKGKSCRYWALAPRGVQIADLGQHDWEELDKEHLHLVPERGSGVVESELGIVLK